MRAWFLGLFGLLLSATLIFGLIYLQKGAPSRAQNLSQNTLDTGNSNSTATPQGSNPSPAMLLTASSLPSAGPSVGAQTSPNTAPPSQQNPDFSPDLSVDSSGLSKASLVMMTNAGPIKIKFYSNDAPKTVKRFIDLVHQGFYNGLTFHRVVPGFVVQGGDPQGNGTGGSGQKLEAEFNKRHHVEGAVAMARASDPNSADSQFYITLGTFPHLDGNYTIFGQVVEGLDVARKLKVGDKMSSLTIQ